MSHQDINVPILEPVIVSPEIDDPQHIAIDVEYRPRGIQGKEVELQKTSTYIQWRLVGDTEWINLVLLIDLKGDQGIQGVVGSDATVTKPAIEEVLTGEISSHVHAADSNKVDKVTGSSLLADAELAILKHETLGFVCYYEGVNLVLGTLFLPRAMPFDFVATRVYGVLSTPATGNALTVNVKKAGTTILNEVLSIAAGAYNGETVLFAGGASSYAFTKGDLLSIVTEQLGSIIVGQGLIIYLEGYRT